MATNCHSGYPLKWFKDQNAARNSFECAICLEVLEDPVQIRDCGHQFCALCIDDILKRDCRCPSCRISISRAMVFEDHAARRLIRKLDVNCCNEGCSWVGDLSSLLEAHMNSCNFLVHSASSVKQSDLEILEAKLESLIFEVSTLKKKHRNDIKQVSAKHEADLKEIKIKHDQEVRQLREQIAFLGIYTNLPPTYLQTLEQLTLNPAVIVALEIPNFTRKLYEANCSNSYGAIESDPFYTSHGYRMKISVYLNEGPCGYTGYMGVYFYLMQGDYDDSLKWPFDKPVTFIVVDQQNDESQIESFEECVIPNGEKALNKPSVESNEGLGFGQFMLHSALGTRQYIRIHTVYIAVAIEP